MITAVRLKLLNIAVALAALLCIATAVLWVRSQFFHDCVERRSEYSDAQLTESRWLRFSSQQGMLYLGYGYHQMIKLLPPTPTSPPRWQYTRYPLSPQGALDGDGPALLERLGISRFVMSSKQIGAKGAGMIDYSWGLRFDYWLLLLMALVLGGIVALMRRREKLAIRLFRTNHCPGCGYDLRAHGKGERCPECGKETMNDEV
jgi:hypothetical protein